MATKTSDDQTVVEAIEDVLKNDVNALVDAHLSVKSIRKFSASPLQHHQVGRDGAARKVYVIADISPQDLNTNSAVEPTEEICECIRKDGYPCDEPGLIVPAEFGAPAEVYNITLWSKLMDTTALDKDKQEIREYLSGEQPNRRVRLEFAFKYVENAIKFYRPWHIYYRFSFYENNNVVKQLTGKLTNIALLSNS